MSKVFASRPGDADHDMLFNVGPVNLQLGNHRTADIEAVSPSDDIASTLRRLELPLFEFIQLRTLH